MNSQIGSDSLGTRLRPRVWEHAKSHHVRAFFGFSVAVHGAALVFSTEIIDRVLHRAVQNPKVVKQIPRPEFLNGVDEHGNQVMIEVVVQVSWEVGPRLGTEEKKIFTGGWFLWDIYMLFGKGVV